MTSQQHKKYILGETSYLLTRTQRNVITEALKRESWTLPLWAGIETRRSLAAKGLAIQVELQSRWSWTLTQIGVEVAKLVTET
jgi:hypothetical protein